MQPMSCKAFILSKYPRLQRSHSLVAFFLRRTVGRSDCSISCGDVNDVSLKEAGNDEDGIWVMLIPLLAGCAVKYLVDVPLDRQQIIAPPLLLLVLGVPGVLLGKQGLDLRRQCLDGEGCHSARATIFSSAIRRFVRGSYQS